MLGLGFRAGFKAVVDSVVAPVNTVAPAISGTAEVGQTLTCSTGTWTGTAPITYAYQWKRNGSNIGGATNFTYTLVTADAGTTVSCTVTATNVAGSASANATGAAVAQFFVQAYSPTAAYSLRKLSSSATSAIRVRRSSDNTEQDIGFVGVDLDTASLASFVGANSAFVVTWYNQGTGGSTFNQTQASASLQPRIVNSGTIDTKNAKNAIYFASDNLQCTNSLAFSSITYSSIVVGSNESNGTLGTAWGIGVNFRHWIDRSGNNLISRSEVAGTYGDTNYLATQNNNNQRLLSVFSNGTATSGYLNAMQQVGDNALPASSTFTGTSTIGDAAFGQVLTGYLQEILIFPSADKSADRTAIETNINSYYGIY